MYKFLNALLLQRQTIYITATTIDAVSSNVQLAFLVKTIEA
jgi:hypothetical protein